MTLAEKKQGILEWEPKYLGWPGIEPGPPALGAWSLSHWTSREVPPPHSSLFFLCTIYHLFVKFYTHTHTHTHTHTNVSSTRTGISVLFTAVFSCLGQMLNKYLLAALQLHIGSPVSLNTLTTWDLRGQDDKSHPTIVPTVGLDGTGLTCPPFLCLLYLRISRAYLCVYKSPSHIRLFATPWTIAHQAPLSMGFSRQEYWSG